MGTFASSETRRRHTQVHNRRIQTKKCQTLLLHSEVPSKPTKAKSSKLTLNKPLLKPENRPVANGSKSWSTKKTLTPSPFFNLGMMPPPNNHTLMLQKPKENWLKLLPTVWKLVVLRSEFSPPIPIKTIFRI